MKNAKKPKLVENTPKVNPKIIPEEDKSLFKP